MSPDALTRTSIVCSIAPLLSVRHGARAVEFYKSAFGATEVFRVEDPSGAVVARLSVDGAEFWLSDESPEHGNFSPESLDGSTARMILTVADPDAMFVQAVAAGAEVVVAVGEAYGWRLGRVVDPFGHHWEIGHPRASKITGTRFVGSANESLAAEERKTTRDGLQSGALAILPE